MNAAAERRVLLAGFHASARTCLSDSWSASWEALLTGTRRFDHPRRHVPGWPDDAPVACLQAGPSGFGVIDRAAELARALGRDARPVHDRLLAANPEAKLSIIVATSHGEAHAVSELAEHRLNQQQPLRPAAARAILCDQLLASFLEGLGRRWPGSTVSAACASACVATGLGADRIRAGLGDACLVVSADVLSRVAHAGFRQIGAMSAHGCRPFDRRRDGTTIGEAGTVTLLVRRGLRLPEDLRFAVEVLGFGQSCDARHPVEPSSEGVAEALRRALDAAHRRPADLAAVYWHGTGTAQNDRTDAAAAKTLFGDQPPRGTTTKGSFGHAMGASAALSLLAAGETLTSRRLPPVAGLEEVEFPWMNLATRQAAEIPDGPVAVMALGFGGINAALVLGASV